MMDDFDPIPHSTAVETPRYEPAPPVPPPPPAIVRPGMTRERAVHVTAVCLEHLAYAINCSGRAPESLAEYSLQELLDANQLVSEMLPNLRTDAGGRVHKVPLPFCDTRTVAALYVAYQFDAQEPSALDVAPVVVKPGRIGVYVLRVPEELVEATPCSECGALTVPDAGGFKCLSCGARREPRNA